MSIFAVIFLNSIKVSGFRFCRCFKSSEIDDFSINPNLSNKLAITWGNTTRQFTVFSSFSIMTIGTILCRSNDSKIRKSVIDSNFIDVVDFIRPNTVDVKPCKTVAGVSLPENSNLDISKSVSTTGSSSFHRSTRRCFLPYKNTRIRVIMQECFELFLCKIRFNHNDLLDRSLRLDVRVYSHPTVAF